MDAPQEPDPDLRLETPPATGIHHAIIQLDPLLVVLSAQLAYQMGILSAQGPTPATLYRDPSGRPDAIGVSLSPAQAAYWNDMPVAGLPTNLSLAQLTQLSRLQIASDRWARAPDDPFAQSNFTTTLEQLRCELSTPPK